jgi:hypothetical protein
MAKVSRVRFHNTKFLTPLLQPRRRGYPALVDTSNMVALMVSGYLNSSFSIALIAIPGNLALSRALGDFEFKKNHSLIAEKQVITSDPDVTVHDISEEDEFLVIACDGAFRRSSISLCLYATI